MNTRLFALPAIAFVLVSCDKAKSIVEQAAKTVQEEIASSGSGGSSMIDPELQKLVDQNAEGVLFRKDQPFPTRLEVRVKRVDDLAVRMTQTSELGRQATTVKGVREKAYKLERSGDQVRVTEEQASFAIPSDDDPSELKKTADPLASGPPPGKPVTFTRHGKEWRIDHSGNFRSAVLSRELAPVLDQLLIDNALAPRPLWFGKRRMKIGETLAVSGEQVPMLLVGGKGKFNLTLQSVEGVAGHPCGVFSITGEYERNEFPDFDGNRTDETVTIQSGKVWLSLLYPLVLKQELDTIQSFKSGNQGNLVGSSQGSVKRKVTCEWKKL